MSENEMKLVKGKGLESSNQDYDIEKCKALDKAFFDKCGVDEYPFQSYIQDMPEPSLNIKLDEMSPCKAYFSWQYGEANFVTDVDHQGKVAISSKRKAMNEMMLILGISEEMAEKYFRLNQEGHFNEEKREKDYRVYWFNRADIDCETFI